MKNKLVVLSMAGIMMLTQQVDVCYAEGNHGRGSIIAEDENSNFIVKKVVPYINGRRVTDFSKIDINKLSITASYFDDNYSEQNIESEKDGEYLVLKQIPKNRQGVEILQLAQKEYYRATGADYEFFEGKEPALFSAINYSNGDYGTPYYLNTRDSKNMIAINFSVKYDIVFDISEISDKPTEAVISDKSYADKVEGKVRENEIVFENVEYNPEKSLIRFDKSSLQGDSSMEAKKDEEDTFIFNPDLTKLEGNKLIIKLKNVEKETTKKLDIKDLEIRKSIYKNNMKIYEHIPQDVDRKEALDNFYIYPNQIEYIKDLELNNAKDLTGIENLNNIEILTVNNTEKVDYNDFLNLEFLEIKNIKLDSLDLSKLVNLKSIKANNLGIKDIKLRENNNIDWLDLNGNDLRNIDLSKFSNLKHLELGYQINKVESIDLSSLAKLEHLSLDSHKLSTIDLSNNKELTHLSLNNTKEDNCGLENIDLSKNSKLDQIHLKDNKLSNLDLSDISVEISGLNINGNQIKTLDLSNVELTYGAYFDRIQNVKLNGTAKDGIITVDLKQIKELKDCSRIIADVQDSVISYDKANAVVKLKDNSKYTTEMSYRYDTMNLKKHHKNMDVNVVVLINRDNKDTTPIKEVTPVDKKSIKKAENRYYIPVQSKGYNKNIENTKKITSKFDNIIDVKNHWARNSIKYTMDKEYFMGTSETTFAPDREVTGAEFITVLGRIANVSSSNNGVYYESYLKWANEKGLLKDFEKFNPLKELTREEMAVILNSYMKIQNIDVKEIKKVDFKDNSKISEFAKDAVKELTAKNVLNGVGGNKFAPQESFTRAQVAQILYNIDNLDR